MLFFQKIASTVLEVHSAVQKVIVFAYLLYVGSCMLRYRVLTIAVASEDLLDFNSHPVLMPLQSKYLASHGTSPPS
jgi:hypothetical protein